MAYFESDHLDDILNVMDESPDLEQYLMHPVIKGEDKKAVIRQIFESIF